MAEPQTQNPNAPAAPAAPLLSPQEMSADQFDQFLKDGKVVEKTTDPTPADQPADPAPAKPAEQAASTDASSSPDSASGKPQQKAKGKPGVKERNETLRAEIEENARLLRERRELREQLARESNAKPTPKPDAPKDSSPAAKESPKERWKRLAAEPDAPKIEQFDDSPTGFQNYMAAMSEFISDKVSGETFERMFEQREAQSRSAMEHEHRAATEITRAEERLKAEEAKYPNWRDEVDPAFAAIPPARALENGQRPHFLNILKDEMLFGECENAIGLGLYASTDEGKAWAFSLRDLPEMAVRRAVMKKDLELGSAVDADTEGRPSTVSKAPKPAPTAGRKVTTPVEPESAALAKGDYLAWEAEQNKKTLAKRSR